MTNWATTEDVYNLTGETVTDADINKAMGIINLVAEVVPDSAFNDDDSPNGLLSTKNLRYLKYATAYQTVWMLEHPDVFTSVDYSSFSEDGLSASQAFHSAHYLAPLARRSIKSLTWMRPNRSIRVRPRLNPMAEPTWNNRDSAAADDDRNWTPM